MDNNEQFSFTYSAQQQNEVQAIRQKYLPKKEDQMERLRRLHHIPTRRAQTAAITVGVIGALIMGLGMSCVMTEIGAVLGALAIVIGISVGLIGMVLVALAYPVYNWSLRRNRKKIAPEILQLTEQLLK